MTNRVELEQVITDHITSWAPSFKVVRENLPAETKDDTEFVVCRIAEGDAFLEQAAGLLDVTGSTEAEPFVLVFDIYTEINTGMLRDAQIKQDIQDHWAHRQLGDVHFSSARKRTYGEQGGRFFHSAVSVDAARYERLIER